MFQLWVHGVVHFLLPSSNLLCLFFPFCTLCSWISLVTRRLRGAFAEKKRRRKKKRQLAFRFRATLFSTEHGVIAQHVTPVMRRYCRCTKNSWQGLQSTKPQNQLSEGVSMISITAGMIIITVSLQKDVISHFVCTESDDSHTANHNISVDSWRSAGGGKVGDRDVCIRAVSRLKIVI